MEKVVLRFLDGTVEKGYVRNFSEEGGSVEIEDLSGKIKRVNVDKLKAIFFVRTFEGNRDYNERKIFSGSNLRLKRIFVKFKDGESMTGYVEGGVPWQKGFFLETGSRKGFFLLPTDPNSNNIKVFVITSSVEDVTLVG